MSNVIRHPSASASSVTIGRFRSAWAVVLTTPAGTKTWRTRLSLHATREEAEEAGQNTAKRLNRPYRSGGGA